MNNIFPSGYIAIEEYVNGLISENNQDLIFSDNFE